MPFFDQHAHRLNRAVVDHLCDGLCTYHPAAPGGMVTGIPYQLDLSFEVYDQDQVAMRVATVLVPVDRVAASRQGDRIELPERTWTVQQIIEDDGQWRRLWVS